MSAVALDSNLLVLLCLGRSSLRHVGAHKKIKSYSLTDFYTLLEIIGAYDTLVSTPYSLAQVSYLLDISEKKPRNRDVALAFRYVVAQIEERYTPSLETTYRDEFDSFGLTYTNWLLTLDNDITFYSADNALVNYAIAHEKSAFWFRPSNQ